MTQERNKGALDKVRPSSKGKGGNLPSAFHKNQVPVFFQNIEPGKTGSIPNASLVYGVGAAVLFGIALFFALSGNWGTGFLLFIPSCALMGYAVHFMRYS